MLILLPPVLLVVIVVVIEAAEVAIIVLLSSDITITIPNAGTITATSTLRTTNIHSDCTITLYTAATTTTTTTTTAANNISLPQLLFLLALATIVCAANRQDMSKFISSAAVCSK